MGKLAQPQATVFVIAGIMAVDPAICVSRRKCLKGLSPSPPKSVTE